MAFLVSLVYFLIPNRSLPLKLFNTVKESWQNSHRTAKFPLHFEFISLLATFIHCWELKLITICCNQMLVHVVHCCNELKTRRVLLQQRMKAG